MPALPLDEAGKYVAAAYLVFLALLLIYVAIMADKLGRFEREIGELAELVGAGAAARTRRPRRPDGEAVPRDRAAGARRLAQDGTGGPARADRAHRAAPPGVPARAERHEDVARAVAISTCNRTELYLVVGDPVGPRARARHARPPRRDPPDRAADVIYSLRNCDAARQLYRVTAGLESMIVGEAEVQGQIKRAYEAALRAGTTGPMTNRLFRAALRRASECGPRRRSRGRAVSLRRGEPRARRSAT